MAGLTRSTLRLFLIVVTISVLIYTNLFLVIIESKTMLINSHSRDHQKTDYDRERTKEDVMACNLPKLNPFDPSIIKYIKKLEGSERCDLNPKYPLLFTTDFDNNLITLKDPRDFGLDKCCYKYLKRPNSGDEFDYWESPKCVPLKDKITHIPAELEFIAVLCETKTKLHRGNKTGNKRAGKLRIIDAFAFVPMKPKMGANTRKSHSRSKSRSLSDPNLNVVILVQDSISHMHFLRSMPKTHEYLTQNLSAIGMNGFVKVGDRSFPNAIATLTGMTRSELIKSCMKSKSDKFDNCSVIWKNFSANGFRTSYFENEPDISLFHYFKPGFGRQPTDYYPRPLALYQMINIQHNGSTSEGQLCLGPRFNFRVLLDYLEKTAWTMDQVRKKYFQIIWDNTLSHGFPEIAYLGDSLVLSTLMFLNDNGFLNHTAFILMSDHGFTFGNLLMTFQGLIEARMPFLYFVLPDWFSKIYPKALANMKLNVERLTTPFDLHETLVDFLRLEDRISDDRLITRQSELMSGKLPRGISLFLPIPSSRTCESASIPIQWCVCHNTTQISMNDTRAKDAARTYIKYLRKFLKRHPECSKLRLQQIRSAKIVQIDGSVTSNQTMNKVDDAIAMVLETVPGNALFEVTLLRMTQGKWRVSSDERINRYGNQSACTSGKNNLKYCYCKAGVDKNTNLSSTSLDHHTDDE